MIKANSSCLHMIYEYIVRHYKLEEQRRTNDQICAHVRTPPPKKKNNQLTVITFW